MAGENKAVGAVKWFFIILLAVTIPGISGWAAWVSAPSVTKFVLEVADLRCALNGPAPLIPDGSFRGLKHLKSVRRTGLDSFEIICVNGAHFYDTIEERDPNELARK